MSPKSITLIENWGTVMLVGEALSAAGELSYEQVKNLSGAVMAKAAAA
jgi:hypothetical protein